MKTRIFEILESLNIRQIKDIIYALNLKDGIPEDHISRIFTDAVYVDINDRDRQGVIMELHYCMPYIAMYLVENFSEK